MVPLPVEVFRVPATQSSPACTQRVAPKVRHSIVADRLRHNEPEFVVDPVVLGESPHITCQRGVRYDTI